MKIALPDKEGLLPKKAEDAAKLVIYDGGSLKEEIPVNGKDEIVSAIKEKEIEIFICQSLGVEMMIDLALNNTEIVGGARGTTESVINAYLSGTLETDDFTLDCGSGTCSGDCTKCH